MGGSKTLEVRWTMRNVKHGSAPTTMSSSLEVGFLTFDVNGARYTWWSDRAEAMHERARNAAYEMDPKTPFEIEVNMLVRGDRVWRMRTLTVLWVETA